MKNAMNIVEVVANTKFLAEIEGEYVSRMIIN